MVTFRFELNGRKTNNKTNVVYLWVTIAKENKINQNSN